jgi:hypothetical protein
LQRASFTLSARQEAHWRRLNVSTARGSRSKQNTSVLASSF